MPAAKAERLKNLAGNPGHRPARQGLEIGRLSLRAPNGLPRAGLMEWRRVVPLLVERGVAGDVDREALADYCLCVARLADAEADVAKRGLLVEGDRGMVKNPACQLAREYRAAMVKWAVQFGLTPAARRGIDAAPQKQDDPFGEYLSQSRVAEQLGEPAAGATDE